VIGHATYSGSIEENLPHGEGTLEVDGKKFKGKWENGRLDKAKPQEEEQSSTNQNSRPKLLTILMDKKSVYVGDVFQD
jgi:hypothetical protein